MQAGMHLDSDKAAFLGISVSNPYYSSSRIESYISWARTQVTSFACLIGDDIYALTHSVFHDCSLIKSLAIARCKGNDIARMINKISLKLNMPTRIFQWRDIYLMEKYKVVKQRMQKIYSEDFLFASLVRREVKTNLAQRIKKKREILNSEQLNRLDLYVIHEIAGLIVMSEYCGYPTEIYPGSDVDILRKIYANRFLEAYDLLPEKPKRIFYHLHFE